MKEINYNPRPESPYLALLPFWFNDDSSLVMPPLALPSHSLPYNEKITVDLNRFDDIMSSPDIAKEKPSDFEDLPNLESIYNFEENNSLKRKPQDQGVNERPQKFQKIE